jgi:two-component system chemotaxis response regulator CheY
MPGERVIVIDDSAAIQETTKAILEEHGMRVTIGSNGLAALTHPEIASFDLVMVDSTMPGIDGLETTRLIKTDKETYKIPVLLMIPENTMDLLESVPLKGATGWIVKPYTPARLVSKVREVMEEQELRRRSEQYLTQAAESHMQSLAEQKIQTAVERKIQIIVERAIQSIVSIIDQRARREVDARVTALTAEKEQELVKMTVQEVAKSMVEKLAERKVTEAMSTILVEQTEKTVKRAADGMLPGMVRERLREQLENTLPREIETRVSKASEARAEEISQNLIEIIRAQAQKVVPHIAKENLPELAERQMTVVAETKMPKIIADTSRAAVANELAQTIRPLVDAEVKKLQTSIRARFWVLTIALLFALVASFFICLILIMKEADKKLGSATPSMHEASPAVMVAQADRSSTLE